MTDFSPAGQDAYANAKLKSRGVLREAARNNIQAALASAGREWGQYARITVWATYDLSGTSCAGVLSFDAGLRKLNPLAEFVMMKTTAALFLVLSLGPPTNSAGQGAPAAQSYFSAEDSSVEKPIPLPQDVRATLSKDELVRNEAENDGIPINAIPSSWFSASVVHLTSPSKGDLLVVAQGPLRGSNVTTFWVFAGSRDGFQLVLTAPAHDLRIRSSRSRAYRDIETTSMTASQVASDVYRFNGKRYTKSGGGIMPVR